MFSLLNIRIGFYLALRQIRRSNPWTTGLVIFVMLLTFLNLVVITGVLVGLVQGINESYRQQYTGDLFITALDSKDTIESTPAILAFLHTLPQVADISTRYAKGGTIEANYKQRSDQTEKPNATGAQIIGIDPSAEDQLTHLSKYIVEGSFLAPGDYDQVLVGSQLLAKYSFGQQPGVTPLENVEIGSTIRLTVGGATREVRVKGILKSKVELAAASVFISDSELRTLIGRDDFNAAQIAVRLTPGSDPAPIRDLMLRSGFGQSAKIQTFEDSIPSGVADIKNTFAMLGNGISSIGLVVASITIFIVIFVNALTRRKFIGILKGIGVAGEAIELSYIFQSLFYALSGSALGLLILYGVLVPSIAAHPIDFPFSDGILVAPVGGTALRVGLLILATVIAGYIPARMIVKRNTLDSILGRA